jgi:hypothetical protein
MRTLKIGLQGFPEREATVLKSMIRLIASPLDRELHLVEPEQANLLLIAGGGRAGETPDENKVYVRQVVVGRSSEHDTLSERREVIPSQNESYQLSRPVRVHALQTVLHMVIHGLDVSAQQVDNVPDIASSNLHVTRTRAAELLRIFLDDLRPRLMMEDGACAIWISANRGTCASNLARNQILPWLLAPVSDGFHVQTWDEDAPPPLNTERIRTSWLRWHATYFGVKTGWVDSRLMFQPLRLRRRPDLQVLAHGPEHKPLVDIMRHEPLPLQLLMARTKLPEHRLAPFLNACLMCGYLDI